MRIFLISIFFLSSFFFGFSQKTIIYDSAAITVREFGARKLLSTKNDPHFQYDKVIESPKSYWDRFWEWFWFRVYRLFGTPTAGVIFEWVIIGFAILVIIFFIVKLTGMTNVGLFGKLNKLEGLNYTSGQEDIHLIDFDAEIQEAIGKKNYRLAIRLLYLQTLKKMTDNGYINWSLNKTNLAYWKELSETSYQGAFYELTRSFEYNWYGNRLPTEEEFVKLQDIFIDLDRKLT